MKTAPGKPKNTVEADGSRIYAFLELRDSEMQRQSEAISQSSSRLFYRNEASADRTAKRIMESVMGSELPAAAARGFRFKSIPRLATIFAAAALLVIFSSTITAAIVKRQGLVEITFILVAPDARSVSLVGDFNGWSLERDLLKKAGNTGQWRITVRLPKGHAYNYNFVLDGIRWIVDPNAAFKLDDGMGGTVSSLVL